MPITITDVQSLVCLQLGLTEAGEDDLLLEELGAESADVINLLGAVEDKYGVVIDEGELPDLRTVRDLYERLRRELGGA